MDFDNYAVHCIPDKGEETFVIVFANLAQGQMVTSIFFDTEDELREELKRMELSDAKIEELIRSARQHADQQAA